MRTYLEIDTFLHLFILNETTRKIGETEKEKQRKIDEKNKKTERNKKEKKRKHNRQKNREGLKKNSLSLCFSCQ
jgi:NH3-dependent NAD+ synthetase